MVTQQTAVSGPSEKFWAQMREKHSKAESRYPESTWDFSAMCYGPGPLTLQLSPQAVKADDAQSERACVPLTPYLWALKSNFYKNVHMSLNILCLTF